MFAATSRLGGWDTQGQAMKKFPLRLDRDLFLKLKVSVANIVDVNAEVSYSEEKIRLSPTEANDDHDMLESSSSRKQLPASSKKSKAE